MSEESRTKRYLRHLKQSTLRKQLFRLLGIGILLFLVGACAIILAAFVWQLQVVIAVAAGVLAMAGAFYLFVKLWPEAEETEDASVVARSLERAREKPKPRELTPEEYRRQRLAAQRLIREKAAPSLAKAIRGILKQDEMERRRRNR